MGFASLHEIAGRIARGDEDVYQEAWVRFVRYNPRNRTGAWKMAQSARNDLWRRERAYRRLRKVLAGKDAYHYAPMLTPEQRKARRNEAHRRWAQRNPEKARAAHRRWYHNNLEDARRRSRERVRKHRARKRAIAGCAV